MADTTTEEPEDVIGYIKTEWDCPYCGEPNSDEGDKSHEDVTCTACGQHAHIGRVM